MKTRRYQYAQLTISILILIFCSILFPGPQPTRNNSVVDISWPNCKISNIDEYSLGIVGVNGGLDFTNNQCLSQEASWLRGYAVYINTGYAGLPYANQYRTFPKDCSYKNAVCLSYNWGYNATMEAIKYASFSNVHSQMWWLDVETDNSWSNYWQVNRASLEGAIDAIQQKVIYAQIGVYSSPSQWAILTNQWHNQLPTWLATGGNIRSIATKECPKKSFTGGTNWLVQYTVGLDHNVVCTKALKNSLVF